MTTYPLYGYGEDQWETLVDEGTNLLEGVSKAQELITYTEFARELRAVGRAPWLHEIDFNNPSDRNLVSHLLERIGEASYAAHGVVLSAVVQSSDPSNGVGLGFFTLLRKLGLYPINLNETRRIELWAMQVKAVHAHYRHR